MLLNRFNDLLEEGEKIVDKELEVSFRRDNLVNGLGIMARVRTDTGGLSAFRTLVSYELLQSGADMDDVLRGYVIDSCYAIKKTLEKTKTN